MASNDLADLLGEPATNLGGRCSAPSDQGRCGCFTGFLSGNELCVGTGCSGTPVSLCDHLSGQELTDAGIGDSGGSAGYFPPCTPLTATAALITDFTSMTGGFGPFDGIGFSGVTFSYPGTIVQSFANMNWNIAGTVSDYSGFGLSLGTCPEVNASAYSGIKFDISGTFALTASEAGTAPTALTFTVGTARDEVASQYQLNFSAADSSTWSFGTCVPASSQFDGSCTDPSTMISVTPTPTTVMLTWDMFGGGKPQSFDPSKITSIGWALPWTGPGGTPYTVNLTLDNIAFF